MSIISFIEKVCVQTAVYWGNPKPDGTGGMTYDPPKEIKVRWEDKAQVITDNIGKEIVSRSEVLVTSDLDEEGMLFLGTLADLDYYYLQREDPRKVEKAYEIKRVDKTPLFRSVDEFVYIVYLSGR